MKNPICLDCRLGNRSPSHPFYGTQRFRLSPMNTHARRARFALVIALLLSLQTAFASAYDARPKLVVVITVDQLRADLLQRFKAKFTDGGFRMLMDRGAYFTDCNYNYVNLHTAPGHATLFTGTYTDGHNIIGNEWW